MEKENLGLLLKLARDSIASHYKGAQPNTSYVRHLDQPRGVFVTLHKNDNLRGCIGYPEPVLPLYQAVIEAARSAALDDPRFPPLTAQELDLVKIELSVLTVPELIEAQKPEEYLDQIELGKDGLKIRTAGSSGLLLPQVATEHGFTKAQFLNALCQKAGLSFNIWKDPSAKIYRFRAEIASE